MNFKIKLIIIKFLIITLTGLSVYSQWICEEDNDCSSVISEAVCSKSKQCRCLPGYTFSSNITKCIPESLYGDSCYDQRQCSHMLTGFECGIDGVCTCSEGFTYVQGRCRKLNELHETCINDIDCLFVGYPESVICKNNQCECADNFYERNGNVCRRIAKLNEKCAAEEDCQGNNLTCNLKKNTCELKTNSIGIQTSIDINEINDNKTNEKNNNNSNDKVNTGAIKKNPKLINFRNTKKSKSVGAKCDEVNECKSPNTFCNDGYCQCKLGFYLEKGNCIGELGVKVTDPEYCATKLIDSNNRCICPAGQIGQTNLRSCIKFAQGFETACRLNVQCSAYGSSLCTPNEAGTRKCVCYPYAKYNPENQLCENKDGYQKYCKTNNDCPDNHACSPENTCLCAPNYVTINETCKPGENAPCKKDGDCGLDNSICSPVKQNNTNNNWNDNDMEKKEEEKNSDIEETVCKCKDEFVYHNEKCHLKATKYEENCDISEQCTPLLSEHSKCEDNKCVCEENYHFSYGKCNEKKIIGEKCKSVAECYTANDEDIEKLECRNSVCQCKNTYTTDKENQQCIIRPKPKPNSSSRPSALKIITIVLTTSAVLITSAALREAYYLR